MKTFYYAGDQSQHGSGHTSKPHRRATGSPGSMKVRLPLNFIRECMRTNKIGSNSPFLIFENIPNKTAHFFALCFID